jgi:hypothetical protein
MHKHDNESEFGLRVFIRYADTHTKTAAEEGDGLRKLNGKTGSAHSSAGASFHSCAIGEISEVETVEISGIETAGISETATVEIYSFSRVASTSCF